MDIPNLYHLYMFLFFFRVGGRNSGHTHRAQLISLDAKDLHELELRLGVKEGMWMVSGLNIFRNFLGPKSFGPKTISRSKFFVSHNFSVTKNFQDP